MRERKSSITRQHLATLQHPRRLYRRLGLFVLYCLLSVGMQSALLGGEQICYFTPPEGWEIDLPSAKVPTIKVGFVGQKQGSFRPTLYLSTEAVDQCTLKEYLSSIRDIYKGNPRTSFKEIGPFKTASLEGFLVEIEATTPGGVSKMVQFILIEEGFAYVLTGANLKERFSDTQGAFLKTFKSVTIVKDPYLLVSDVEKRARLQKELQKENLSLAERERLLNQEPSYLKALLTRARAH